MSNIQLTGYSSDSLGVEQSYKLGAGNWHIYEVKGERWYFKVEQPELLSIHRDAKYLGRGEKPATPKHDLKSEVIELRRLVKVEPSSVKTIKPIPQRKNIKANKFKCCYCETPLTKENYTKDHIIPKDRGGTDKASNLRPCCFACNQEKGNMMPHIYAQSLEIQLEILQAEVAKLQIKIKNVNAIASQINI